MSARFDRQAALVVGLAIEQARKAAGNRRLVPYIRVRIPNPPVDGPRENRPARLSPTERSWCRAMYYDPRIHQLTSRRKPDARWSLRLDWETVPLLPGQQRYVKVTVFPDTEGARYVKRNPPVLSYAETPELRSAGGRQE